MHQLKLSTIIGIILVSMLAGIVLYNLVTYLLSMRPAKVVYVTNDQNVAFIENDTKS